MLRITEYEGPYYYVKGESFPRTDYIKFEWERGYLQMTKHAWNKLSKKKRDLILMKGRGK